MSAQTSAQSATVAAIMDANPSARLECVAGTLAGGVRELVLSFPPCNKGQARRWAVRYLPVSGGHCGELRDALYLDMDRAAGAARNHNRRAA